MSFDVKLLNGDVIFDTQGRLELVRDSNKIVQSVLKLLGTTIRSDPYSPEFGVSVTEDSVGSPIRSFAITQRFENEIEDGLLRLKREQQALSNFQFLTTAERIRSIDRVFVEMDKTDPRQFNVEIVLTTFSQTPITVEANIRA